MNSFRPESVPDLAPLVAKIAEHPRYGPAVAEAAKAGRPLALNYHTHEPGGSYCVSLCAVQAPVIALIGQPELDELAHVRGFADSEATCLALNGALTEALMQRYALTGAPAIYLNGKPRTEATPPESHSG